MMTKEEAINLVKQVLPCLNVDEKIREGFKTLIPELAESEEERMVKAITHVLYENYTDAAVIEGVEIAEIVTWLEKQKDAFENGRQLGIMQEQARQELEWPDEKQKVNTEGDFGRGYDCGYEACLHSHGAEWFEKQKEQKPAEWSEEDKVYLEDALWCVRQAVKVAKDENDMGACWSAENWLKSLPERFNLQPKEEWSEEDDKMCNSILNELTLHLVYDGTYTGTTLGKKYKYGSEIRWIKSLPERFNLQPKEEQSKYDGNMDKECIKLCNTLNSIPSIDTFESCCGHLKDSYSVWFFCNDIIAISRLGRCVERNYSDGKWELLVDSTDTHPTGVFWLRSKVPFQSYDEMEESVNELCVCIQHWFNTKFDSYFNSNACK